jgi:hypothetical protein
MPQAVIIFKDRDVALETSILVWIFGELCFIPQFVTPVLYPSLIPHFDTPVWYPSLVPQFDIPVSDSGLIKVTDCWYVIPCILVCCSYISEKTAGSKFRVESLLTAAARCDTHTNKILSTFRKSVEKFHLPLKYFKHFGYFTRTAVNFCILPHSS